MPPGVHGGFPGRKGFGESVSKAVNGQLCGQFRLFIGAAVFRLNDAARETLAADDQLHGNADKVGILELDARTLVTVVKQDFQPQVFQKCCDFGCFCADV